MTAESVRILAILLQPFMPERMKLALDLIEVDESTRTFQHAHVGADFNYATSGFDVARDGVPEQLFPLLLSSY